MKKTLKCIICCFLCIVMAGLPALAATPSAGGATPPEATMNIQWKGNYETNRIEVTFESPADYNQWVSAVLYPDGATPNFGSYKRLLEIQSVPGVQGKFAFTIAEDLIAENGHYKLRLRGNGEDSTLCQEEVDVYVITPTAVAGLCNAVSTADASSISAAITPLEKALQMDIPPADRTDLLTALCKSQSLD